MTRLLPLALAGDRNMMILDEGPPGGAEKRYPAEKTAPTG